MEKILIILNVLVGLSYAILAFPEGGTTVLFLLVLSVPAVYLIRRYTEEKALITSIFLLALFFRLALGLLIHLLDLRIAFGGDAVGYDLVGQRLAEIWQGRSVPNDVLSYRAKTSASGWGIHYIVASIYYIFGRNILLAQAFCGFIGALTAPMIYFCALEIFDNRRVAKISGILIAVFPSFVIWSSQLIKDGLIVFLLVFVMTLVLQLHKKLSYLNVGLLILSLLGIMSLRFYILYMVAVAIVGSFVIGLESSVQAMIRNALIMIIMGVGLTYLGVIRNASSEFEKFGSLERIAQSRRDLASAESGFGVDLDVSTPLGALYAVPTGFAYLMFAPFPWEIKKMNQLLTLPDVLTWWASMPILIFGLWYTVRLRLRKAIPVLIFSLMLTISYSIFQGNVGMVYRQRTQIQVFLFIFIAVGWALIMEKRQDRKLLERQRRGRSGIARSPVVTANLN